MRNQIPRARPVQSDDIEKGSGALACLLFAAILICAFWLGAILAAHSAVR